MFFHSREKIVKAKKLSLTWMHKTSHGFKWNAKQKVLPTGYKEFLSQPASAKPQYFFICWFSRWSKKVALRAWSNVKAGTGMATISPKLVGRVNRSFKDGTKWYPDTGCVFSERANVRYNYPLKPRLGGSGTGTLRPNVPPADIWQDYQISKFTASKLANIGFLAKCPWSSQPRWG